MNLQNNLTSNFVVIHGTVPAELSLGKIYVNTNGTRAHHLCACGCGNRVLTPLNNHEWRLTGTDNSPSLSPSVGNWNLRCQSHYLIRNGRTVWSSRWSAAEIAAGRLKEQKPYLETHEVVTKKSWICKILKKILNSCE